MIAKQSYYCIVCATEFTPGAEGIVCPQCGWRIESSPSRPVPDKEARSKRLEPKVRARLVTTSFPSKPFFRVVPPLVDIGIHSEELSYGLSDALDGKAASLSFWGKDEFEFSTLLAVERPIGVSVLPEGDPVVISAKGIAVIVSIPPGWKKDTFPNTRGHRTGWDVSCYALHPSGDMLVFGIPADGAVRGLMIQDFIEKSLLEDLPGNPSALVFSSSGRQLMIGCSNGDILVREQDSGRAKPIEKRDNNEGVMALASCPSGGWTAIFEDNVLTCWDASGTIEAEEHLDIVVNTLDVDSYTGNIVIGGNKGEIQVWSADLSEQLVSQQVHSDKVMRVLFSSDGQFIISAGREGEAKKTRIA